VTDDRNKLTGNVLPNSPTVDRAPDRTGSDASSKVAPDYLYLRPLRTSGARPPLICFFPGPPGARDLAESLPEDQPVYEFFWPNMDEASSFPSVEQLAALFVSDVRKLRPHGPYQFCGYSTFGLVAYEMGQMLIAQGEDVPFLALFDIWHPQFMQMLTPREMARYKVFRIIDRVEKYRRILREDGVTHVAGQVIDFVVRKTKSIIWRVLRFAFRKGGRPVPKGVQIIEVDFGQQKIRSVALSKKVYLDPNGRPSRKKAKRSDSRMARVRDFGPGHLFRSRRSRKD